MQRILSASFQSPPLRHIAVDTDSTDWAASEVVHWGTGDVQLQLVPFLYSQHPIPLIRARQDRTIQNARERRLLLGKGLTVLIEHHQRGFPFAPQTEREFGFGPAIQCKKAGGEGIGSQEVHLVL